MLVFRRFLGMLLLSVLIVSLTGCGGGGGSGTGTGTQAQISALTDAFIQACFEGDEDALRSSEFFTSQVLLIMESEDNPLSGSQSRSDLVDILKLVWRWENRVYEIFELTDCEITVNGSSAVLTDILQEQYENTDLGTAYISTTEIEITYTKGASGWRISGLSLSSPSRTEI